MRVIIENTFNSDNLNLCTYFVEILNGCTKAKSTDDLRSYMDFLFRKPYISEYFIYGFGHFHMWVKLKNMDDRLILVEF